ncbi:MAG: hypothetical protein WBO24_12185 [Nitrospirales bacterium]
MKVASESFKVIQMFAFKFEPSETAAVNYTPAETVDDFSEARALQCRVPGIAGFGLSERDAVTVFVENRAVEKYLPETLDGREVRVEVTGEVHAQRLA